MGINNVNYAGYGNYESYVNPNFKAGEVKTETISPQTRVIYNTKPDEFVKTQNVPKEYSKGSIVFAKILGAGLAIGGLVAAVKLGPRALYAARNVGKKGVQNFLNGNADQKLKDVITKVSENAEVKATLDKMGIRNIKRIAQSAEVAGVSDLMTGKAKLLVTNSVQGGQLESVVNFANKKGYAFYKEAKRAEEYSRMFNFLNNGAVKGLYNNTTVIDIMNSSDAKVMPLQPNSQRQILFANPNGKTTYREVQMGANNLGKEWEFSVDKYSDLKTDNMGIYSSDSFLILNKLYKNSLKDNFIHALVFERPLNV